MASIIESGFGAHPWIGSQVGPITGWPFLQSLLHFCPWISFKQEQFWVKSLKVGWWPLAFTGGPIYWRWPLQVPFLHCWAFWLRSSPLSPGRLSHPKSLEEVPLIPHPPQLHISIHSPGPLGCSPVSLHTRFCPSFTYHSPLLPSLPLSTEIILSPF